MQEIKRMETITQNFNLLQGLRVAPFGLFIMFDAVAHSWLPWYVVWRPLSSGAALLLAAALSLLAHRYYRRNFGQVRPLHESGSLTQAAIILLGLALVVISGHVERWFSLPVSLFGLTLAAFTVSVLYIPHGRLRPHHLMFTLTIVGLSLLPLTGLLAVSDLFGPDNQYAVFVVGLGFVLIGLGDHWLLVRGLQPLPEEA